MFWSKIWFFLVAVLAAVAITIALVLPQPAERATNLAEKRRLARACSVANILLRDSARKRVQLVGEFARAAAPEGAPKLRLGTILFEASKSQSIAQAQNSTGKKALIELLKGDGVKPSMVVLLDNAGRVVARSKSSPDADKFGDSLRGYFLVDDALDGYLRDDLWLMDGKLYRVAASPVLTSRTEWAGAVVLGSPIDNKFATSIESSLGVYVTFYANGEAVASSSSVQIHKDVLANHGKMSDVEPGKDCTEGEPFDVVSGGKTYSAIISRLPGEAGEGDNGAFFTVFIERESGVGFMGTLDKVRKNDLSFSTFPWIKLGIAFVLLVGIGIGLMVFEADRPLRRLTADTVKLAQGQAERLDEEKYRGKMGSIARSVNITIDKLAREAKSARKELDQLLGPVPGGDGAPSPMPAAGPLGPSPEPFNPPPPSEFKFGGAPGPGPAVSSGPSSGFNLDVPPPAASSLAQTQLEKPPPHGGGTPPPIPSAPTDSQVPPPPIGLPKDPSQINRPPTPNPVVQAIDDDILSTQGPTLVKGPHSKPGDEEKTVVSDQSERIASGDAEVVYFREIFEDFIALKRKCGESTDNLTFEKFSAKLKTNRDALIAKHGCRSVKFQVYIKDGKAALKASPVR